MDVQPERSSARRGERGRVQEGISLERIDAERAACCSRCWRSAERLLHRELECDRTLEGRLVHVRCTPPLLPWMHQYACLSSLLTNSSLENKHYTASPMNFILFIISIL